MPWTGDTREGARAKRERRPCDGARARRAVRQRAASLPRLCLVREAARLLADRRVPRPRHLEGWPKAEAQTTELALVSVSTQTVQVEYFEMSVHMSDIFQTEGAVSVLVDSVEASRVERKCASICPASKGCRLWTRVWVRCWVLNVCAFPAHAGASVLSLVFSAEAGLLHVSCPVMSHASLCATAGG